MKRIINNLIAAACLLPAVGMAATATLNPVADAYVRDLSTAAVNYGTATELRVQNGGTRINHESYLKFDASAASGQISSAKLRVYAALSGVGSVSTSAYGVGNTSWGETTITWNNKPALGNSLGSVSVSSTAYAWKEIDVTAYVQSERAAGRSVISLGLRSNSLPSKAYVSASSREGANPPKLVLVTNDAPSVSLTAPIAGSTYTAPASITLTANAADADGSIASVEFYNGATLIGTGTLTGGSYTLDWINVGVGSYSLTAKGTDNQGAVTVSAPVSISVNAPNVPPSISLTAPAGGSSYTAPASITLTADASDSDGSIASVEFYDGATLIGAGTLAGGSYTLDWSNVGAGNYSITVKATDNQGAVTVSAPVTISVNAPNVPPSVSVTAPAGGSSYTAPASVPLSANAADADGSIASVEFYNGAALIGTGTLAGGSYTFAWSNVAAGSYSLTAVATDDQGAATISAPASISVNPPANVPPSVSLTAPVDGSSYTAPASITLTADATDSDGSIAAVEFYDGATLIASLTALPYSYTWNDVQSGSHSLTAKATDNQGMATTSTPVTVTVNVPLASGVYYIHADHLNTPRVITDASNRIVWRWDSDPFGASTANEDPDGDGAKFTYNLRFPGQYYDRETNLHYNYFRDYDPTTGRYVQSDPIGLEGGMNVYSYVLSNPVSLTDPFGLDTAGCDLPLGSFIRNPRVLECCARHDKCFDDNKCTSTSWLKDDSCNSEKCDSCNREVSQCFKDSFTGPATDDPKQPNYYCAKQHRYILVPGDFPTLEAAMVACQSDSNSDQTCCLQ